MIDKYRFLDLDKTTEPVMHSFLWKSMSKGNKVNDELFNIYIALIKYKLIDTTTAKSVFQDAFRGLELKNIKKKINWTGSFRLLIYFFARLSHRQHIISKTNYQWKTLEKTFLWNKKPINPKICANVYSNLYTSYSEPKDAIIIEDILRRLF